MCTEAGLFAIRAGRDYVLEEDFMKASRKASRLYMSVGLDGWRPPRCFREVVVVVVYIYLHVSVGMGWCWFDSLWGVPIYVYVCLSGGGWPAGCGSGWRAGWLTD